MGLTKRKNDGNLLSACQHLPILLREFINCQQDTGQSRLGGMKPISVPLWLLLYPTFSRCVNTTCSTNALASFLYYERLQAVNRRTLQSYNDGYLQRADTSIPLPPSWLLLPQTDEAMSCFSKSSSLSPQLLSYGAALSSIWSWGKHLSSDDLLLLQRTIFPITCWTKPFSLISIRMKHSTIYFDTFSGWPWDIRLSDMRVMIEPLGMH